MENGKIIMAAVTLLIGAILIGVVMSEEITKTSLTSTTETKSLSGARLGGGAINETYSYSLTNGQVTGWRDDDSTCSINTIVVKNASGFSLSNNGCGSGGDYYYIADSGSYVYCNSAVTNRSNSNTTTVTYNYCPDNYVASAWGRSTLNMVGGFLAILLLGIAIYYLLLLYKYWKIE
jgi:hypothetical protein